MRIQIELDFLPKQHMVRSATALILHAIYYFKLPQLQQALVNGNAVNYTLTTYTGPGDLRTLSPAEVQLNILELCMQDLPILLKASNFNLQSANTDCSEIGLEIEGKIRQLAWPEICASVFHKVCPGYSDKPHATLEHIWQTYKDVHGTVVTSPVFAYYHRIMNAIRPLARICASQCPFAII